MARLFNPDPDVVRAAWLYFVLVGMSFGLRAVYLVGSAGLNALNHAGSAIALTVLHGVCVSLPLAWLLSRRWGLIGIFAGLAVGNAFGGLTTAFWLRRTIR